MQKSDYKELKYQIYEKNLPEDINNILINMYNSAYCNIDFFKIYLNYDELNAIFYLNDSEIVHIIIYTIVNDEIDVLNRLCYIEEKYINNFCDIVFKKYDQVKKIKFAGLYMDYKLNLYYPQLIINESEDIILELPSSMDEYTKKLGKKTRRHIKYYIKRVGEVFNDFEFLVFQKENIEKYEINKIIDMNHKRMENKGLKSGIDKSYRNKILEYYRIYGNVCTIKINGEINAGTIIYRVGSDYYLHVISHNPAYDKYNVGQICLFLTIKYCIENEGRKLHLLWGKSEYKYRFLGNENKLVDLCVYRLNIYKIFDYSNIYNRVFQIMKNKVLKIKVVLEHPAASEGLCSRHLFKSRQRR